MKTLVNSLEPISLTAGKPKWYVHARVTDHVNGDRTYISRRIYVSETEATDAIFAIYANGYQIDDSNFVSGRSEELTDEQVSALNRAADLHHHRQCCQADVAMAGARSDWASEIHGSYREHGD